MDKTTLILGILIGIIIGFIISGLFLIYGISEIGNSIHIQSIAVNTSVNIPINETRMVEAINQSMQR